MFNWGGGGGGITVRVIGIVSFRSLKLTSSLAPLRDIGYIPWTFAECVNLPWFYILSSEIQLNIQQ